MSSASSYRIETATSAEELSAHQDAWRELGTRLLEPNPTYHPDFLMAGLKAFPAATTFVLIYGGERLEGFFPLMRAGSVWRLYRHPYSPLQTPWLGDADAVVAFWDWLVAAQSRGTRVLELEQIPVGGFVHTRLLDEAFRRGLLSWVGDSYGRALFRPSPEGHEAYLARALDGGRRKKFRNLRKRLEAQAISEAGSGLTTRVLAREEDLAPWIRDFLALEAGGWKGRAGSAASQSPVTREFLETVFSKFHASGELEMIGLALGDRLIALKVNLWSGSSAYTYKIAFDERYAAFSPGVHLELENIRLAHAPGARPLEAMDSCTAPGNFRFMHLWPGRVLMESRLISTGSWAGDWQVTRRALLRFISRTLSRAASWRKARLVKTPNRLT